MNIYNGDVSRLWLMSFLLGAILGFVYDATVQLFSSANIKPPPKFQRAWGVILKITLTLRDFLFCVLFPGIELGCLQVLRNIHRRSINQDI